MMKKVFLLVAVFLVGITTQAFTTTQENVGTNPGKKHRYYNSQEIRFVENGVLYSVAINGTFNFKILKKGKHKKWRTYNNAHLNNKYRKGHRPRVITDRRGNIVQIGRTQITYQRNGKVRTIGNVPLHYYRGRLMSVGNMDIVYNRFGKIRSTYGTINRFNDQDWHDDWYSYNDYDDDDDWNRKRRKREIK